jgi:hypothetical protein
MIYFSSHINYHNNMYVYIYIIATSLLGIIGVCIYRLSRNIKQYHQECKDILQRINETDHAMIENETQHYEKTIESLVINKLYSSSIDTLRIERHRQHTICKYYDVNMTIRYDKYYAYDIADGREYLHISLMDYYKKDTRYFLNSLFNKYVIDINLSIELYNINIDIIHHKYTVTTNRYTVKSSVYIPKLSTISYDNIVIDNDNAFIKLLMKLVEDKNTEYFFIHRQSGTCNLLFTNGTDDIVFDTFDRETSVSTRYIYA